MASERQKIKKQIYQILDKQPIDKEALNKLNNELQKYPAIPPPIKKNTK